MQFFFIIIKGGIFLLGVIVNSIAIIIGSVIGLFLSRGIKESLRESIMNGLALCVILIGISGSLKGNNTMLIIISIVIGVLIGEGLDIDLRLGKLGDKLQQKLKNKGGKVSEGFVTTTLLMCVGAMSIIGAIDSGLNGNNSTLFAKSLLDGFSAIIFSSTYGIGVIFTSISVFVYEGIIAISASLLKGILVKEVIDNITSVGSLLIMGLGFNMLNITKIKVANFIPAMLIPFVYQIILNLFA